MNPFLEFILFLVFSVWLLTIVGLIVRATDFGYLNPNKDSLLSRAVMLVIAVIMTVIPLLVLNWSEGGILF